MAGRTHYETLGLSSSAGAEAIALAFKTLMRRLHPDVTGDAESARHAAEVTAAYAVLSRPDRRAEYDRHLRTAWRRELLGPHQVRLEPQRTRFVTRRRNPRTRLRMGKLLVVASVGGAAIVGLATHLQGRVEDRALAALPIRAETPVAEIHAPAYVEEANATVTAVATAPSGPEAVLAETPSDTRLAGVPAVDRDDVIDAARQVAALVTEGRLEEAQRLSVECRQSSVIEPHWRAQDFCVGLDLAGLIALDRLPPHDQGESAAYFRRVGGDATRHYAGLPAPQGEAEHRLDRIRELVAHTVVETVPVVAPEPQWKAAAAAVANVLSPARRNGGSTGF